MTTHYRGTPAMRLPTLLFIAALGTTTAGQGQTNQITATRAATPPRIDGVATDPVWQTAERRGDFRTFSPREDGDPVFRTELQAAYDDRALYVLVRAFDPRPDS